MTVAQMLFKMAALNSVQRFGVAKQHFFDFSLLRAFMILGMHSSKVLNLASFFCPSWVTKALRSVRPDFERLPLVRDIACGQSIIMARH